MSLRPQEIVRSEVEGELSGPANSLTAESIDCGCGRYRMPRLATFATRRIFLSLLCCIGVLQAAAQAYFYVTSSTIARRFHIDPYLMEWILCTSEVTIILLGVIVAYWGDKFHRASWLGGLTLLQCATFFMCVIPHMSHYTHIVHEGQNVSKTHLSVYSEESPDLCMKMSSRLIVAEDPPHYTTLFILIALQIVTAMANIAYYALGVSYLDDNTKKVHVPVYFGVALAVKVLGSVLGFMMGWGFLRIDADNFTPIWSYRDQLGAWWLGWPLFAIALAIPAFIMAIFPRKLPSEMVHQAAASIIEQSGTLRGSQRPLIKVGNPDFFPSVMRLLTNKVLIFNVLSAAFLMTAITNFTLNENLFLESRFYAPRPTGMLLGFGDPILSRSVTTIIKPVLIGLSMIISGLVIAYAKPTARSLVIYSVVILSVSSLVIFLLSLDNCQKADIYGSNRGSLTLLKFCNKDCKCSRDADFRPVCDSRGTVTFYSPCHAGCTSTTYKNNTKIYSNCSCVEDRTGQGNTEARDGPCGSDNCQVGWLLFEIFTLAVYATVASTLVGDLLIGLRCVNIQDKALTIGYSMALLLFFTFIPGKVSYDLIATSTCQHWGANDRVCHLYHPTNLGNYLCFVTGTLLVISAILKIGVWFFSSKLDLYDTDEIEAQDPTELKDISTPQAEPLLSQQPTSEQAEENQTAEALDNVPEPVIIIEHKKLGKENGPVADVAEGEASSSRLQYGPLGPGRRRLGNNQSNASIANIETDDDLDSSDGSQDVKKGSVSQVSYKPLELDSDVESELSEVAPRSRKRLSSNLDESKKPLPEIKPPFSNLRFPDPNNYEDPRLARSSRNNSPNLATDGSSKTDSFEYRKKKDDKPPSGTTGNFNELGIPVVEAYEAAVQASTSNLRSPTIMMAIQHLDRTPSRELLEESRFVYNPSKKNTNEELEENRKFRLEKLIRPMNYSPVNIRSPSRDQASSGFGSSENVREKARLHSDVSDSRDSLSSKSSMSGPPKSRGGPLCTDL